MNPAARIDESAQPESRLEWWFFHGRYCGPRTAARHFMVSLFRFQIPQTAGSPATAFSALISTLDPESGRQWTSTRVDHKILDALERPGDGRDVDPFAAAVVLDEVRRFGLPREFHCPPGEPSLQSSPLCFVWADLALQVHAPGILLRFHDPATLSPVTLELSPVVPRLEIDVSAVGEPGEAMNYVSYPVLALEGSVAGQPIQGDAWFDHQWGGCAWVQDAARPPRPRGWDWLGFRLDDGACSVVMSHWDAVSGQEFARHLTLRTAGGEILITREFQWVPTRWWTSTATRVTHPVAWTLRIPQWDAELVFEPLAENQEIRVFGSLRAIWEGAGRLHGHLYGHPVEGTARLEGQGRGYLFDTAGYLRAWAGMVDRELARFLPRNIEEPDLCRFAGPPAWVYEPDSYTSVLSRPLWDLMERDGKRWRAVLSFLLLDALGRDPEPLLDVGFVLPELLHNASLIIDDIQDDSTLRRGHPSIHARYGVDIAISAANTAYFLPMLVVLDHPVLTREEKQGLCEAYQRQLVRAHLGQSFDLYLTHNLSSARLDTWMADSIGPKILQMYALKTAAPVEGLAEAAALLAGASPQVRHAAVRFARSFGLAFQLIDDVKNFSEAPGWGKQRGEDLASGKLTYLILRALELLAPPERACLREILCRPELRHDPAGLRHGIDLVVRSGACEALHREARASVAPEWEAFSRLVPPSSSKSELRMLWEALIEQSIGKQTPLES